MLTVRDSYNNNNNKVLVLKIWDWLIIDSQQIS